MRVENVDNACRQLAEFMHRVENRLAMERLGFCERYLKGGLEILADFDIVCGGHTEQYHAVFNRAAPEILNSNEWPVVRHNAQIFDPDVMQGRNQCLVFVGNVQVMNGSEKVVPSLVRLQRSDYLDDIFSGSVYMSFSNHVLKAINIVPEGEIDLIGTFTSTPHQFGCQQVKGRSQIMDYITNDSSERLRNLVPDAERPEVVRGVGFLLYDNAIRFRPYVVDDFVVKLNDVLFGPINF